MLGNGTTTPLNITLIARGLGSVGMRTTAQTPGTIDVSGTFQTGSGLTGTVQGSLQGTLQNGSFDGTLTSSPDCVRPYAGPITESALAWVARGASGASCVLPDSMQLPRTAAGSTVCTINASLTRQSFSGNGGSAELIVDTGTTCAWAPESLDSFIRLDSTDAKVGPGRVTFTVAANTAAARDGRLRVGSQTLTVTEGAACTTSVSPSSLAFDGNGGSGTVSITTAALCDWTAQSPVPWVTVAPSSGAGNATVTITAQANSGTARDATLSIAGRTVTVSQPASCGVSISPTSATHSEGAQNQSVAISTGPGCTWTARSSVPWITLAATTGIGPGGLGYTLQANTGPRRNGSVTVVGTGLSGTIAITQLSGCTYAMTQVDLTENPSFFSPSRSVGVTTNDSACHWTLRLSAPWLTINGQSNVDGAGSMSFPLSAELNCTGAPRTVTLALVDEDGAIRVQQDVVQQPTIFTSSCTSSFGFFRR
jgi:hypothetical protein